MSKHIRLVSSVTNYEALDRVYKQNLEESIVSYISEEKKISIETAMDIFYNSKLSVQINEGKFGIENMDYKYLANDLMVNEAELFVVE